MIQLEKSPSSQLLVIECEDFFSETKNLLLAEVAKSPAAGNSSAKPAGTYGAKFTGWKANGSASPPPVKSMEPLSDPGEASSAPSSGGISSTEIRWKSSLILSMKNSFNTKR